MSNIMRKAQLLLLAGLAWGGAGWCQVPAKVSGEPLSTPPPSATIAAPSVTPVVDSATKAGPSCELHGWPAERFMAMTTGLLGGGLLDMAIHADKDKSNRTQMANALSSSGQLDALASLDLAAALKLQPVIVIRHETPLERHTMNSIKNRRADSKASCYYELIVGDIFYQKAAIYGRSLRALFMLRDFGSGSTVIHEYKNWGGNGLKLFPPKEGEDFEAANNELVGVFKLDFDEFARNAVSYAARQKSN